MWRRRGLAALCFCVATISAVESRAVFAACQTCYQAQCSLACKGQSGAPTCESRFSCNPPGGCFFTCSLDGLGSCTGEFKCVRTTAIEPPIETEASLVRNGAPAVLWHDVGAKGVSPRSACSVMQ